MLIDKNGKVFNPANLPPNTKQHRAKRDAVLADLREVLVPARRGHADFFSVQQRARLVG